MATEAAKKPEVIVSGHGRRTRGPVPKAAAPTTMPEDWSATTSLRWNGEILEQQWVFIHRTGDATPEYEYQWVAVGSV